MSTRRSLVALSALLCALLALACGDDPPPPVEEEPVLPVQRPQTAAAAEDLEPTPAEVPIPEDFAAEAEREISTSDMRAQLDALEEEITLDK